MRSIKDAPFLLKKNNKSEIYFGKTPGEVLALDSSHSHRVTAVYKNEDKYEMVFVQNGRVTIIARLFVVNKSDGYKFDEIFDTSEKEMRSYRCLVYRLNFACFLDTILTVKNSYYFVFLAVNVIMVTISATILWKLCY